jgi:hypothetical protein
MPLPALSKITLEYEALVTGITGACVLPLRLGKL